MTGPVGGKGESEEIRRDGRGARGENDEETENC